jgi:peptidyl-tRNA hydrolase
MSSDKDMVTIELEVPLTTVGKAAGGKYDGNKAQTVHHGKVTVTSEVAEDLLRRQKEYLQYERTLIRDNGRTGIDSGTISGNQA